MIKISHKDNVYEIGGLDFISVLTILFIAFKLAGIIDWSWWWVLSPILISIPVLIFIVIITAVIGFIWGLIEDGK